MSFLNQFDIDQLKGKLSTDISTLGKIYKAKKSPFQTRSVDHSLVEEYLKDGWEVEKELKTKTTLKKSKSHSKKFEDDIWCQFYELGYRHLNYDDRFHLPFTSNPEDRKQIDVIAIDNETVIIVECKSSDKPKKATSYRETFDALGPKINGFRKVISQAFGKDLKVKYIFATRNLRMNSEDIDLLRLSRTGAFYFNDNTFDYINLLIKNYKGVARYQFFGMLFKNEIINLSKIEIPAVEGDMGGKKYYMFAIEPFLLLKMGFVLHRTKANEAEFPTYQRLLVPKRLNGITKYIDDGGYFPNSLILNFSQKKHKVIFEPSSRTGDSRSRFGMLKIPNAYAIAYVIDGQHRLYGYANSSFKETNTIPVVAFNDLSTIEQLEIFMDINQNQKAVSPSLRLDLEEDLFWDSDRADSRIKALRSSIIKGLSNSPEGPLYKLISVGEDTYKLTFKPFSNALTHSGLLPFAKGNQYVAENSTSCLYNINNHNHDEEMKKSKKNIVDFLNACYELAEDNDFILSNRGTYAFVVLIGRLNTFLTDTNKVRLNTSPKERFSEIEKYISALLEHLKTMPAEEEAKFLKLYGSGAESGWLKPFISIVNTKFPEYNPKELIDWKERQDEQLQEEGRKYSIAIEKQMKKIVLEKIKILFGENWDLEINSIKRECIKRAEEENEKHYKEGLNKKTATIWTEMFNINDYKSIIDKYWAKTPDGSEKNGFTTYSDDFSIDIGQGFNSKSDRIKWISFFNSYRNQLAHEGTKEKGLNKEEVEFLKKIYDHFEN